MSVSAACRGCGRPVRLPDGTDPASARCPGCQEKRAAGREPVLSLDDEPPPQPPASRPGQPIPARREPVLPSDERPPAADSGPPSWLVGVAGVFALALWVGPVAVSQAAGLNFGLGMLVGGLLAAAVLTANALIVFVTRLGVGAKVGLMAGVAVAVLTMFFAGAYLAGWDRDRREEQVQ
ncbi:MAG TPA: hypothetical protein VKE74_28835, partial [Gemmataceae bacterium]|nr:hypothetical protein [Gemmataceae bacterium]